MLFTYAIILYTSGSILLRGEGKFEETKTFDLINYPFFFGIALLNYEGNPVSLNIRSSMQNPQKFVFSYNFSVFTVMIFSCCISSFCYSAFGPTVNDFVLLSLPDSTLVISIRILYWICLLGSYPIQMFAPLHIIENYSWYHKIPTFENFDLRYYGIRALYVIFTGIMAIIVPRFGLFLDFLGSFAGTALWLIIPVIIYEKAFKGTLTVPQIILNKIILIIGVVFGGISTALSFYTMITEL